jgi:neutral amino acid transport system ATP-binding protein
MSADDRAATAEAASTPPGASALAGTAPEPGVAKPDAIFVADDVVRSFGGLRAVDVHHLEVQRGTITSLIGPNGAGKSTFFNLVTGFDKPDSGRWSFQGEDISGQSAYRIARRGMVRTFQLTKALTRLTARENLMLGATGQLGERFVPAFLRFPWRAQEHEIGQRADELLERFNLAHMRDEYAGTMSGGQRKLLEMARALMVKPSMIMLDEPMAGVNPALTQSLLGHIRELRDDGTPLGRTTPRRRRRRTPPSTCSPRSTSWPGTCPRSTSSTAATCTSTPVSSSASSVRTAPASRR